MKKYILLFILTIIVIHEANPALADGQGVPINYDSLSFVEEPLATEVGPATLGINLLFDQSVGYSNVSEDDTYNTRVNGEVSAQTQLPNSWQVEAKYIARYNRIADEIDDDEGYNDDMALSISDEWGTIAGGNVTGSVYEKTRRQRGVGNAVLSNDSFLGELDETGGFYSVRYNSYEASITADKEGQAEAAISFERPIGNSNYFGSFRVRKGNLSENADYGQDADTIGSAVVAEYSYASFLIDGQIGYENIDSDSTNDKSDHVFTSTGVQYKTGAYSFSAEGGLGRYDGDNRRAASLGSRVDVARGASLNLGANYTYENNHDETTGTASVRYEF